MASEPPRLSSIPSKKMKNPKRKRTAQNPDLERIDSLSWIPSLPNDDPFSVLAGTNELEGGFLSLEEIDESEYGLEIAEPEKEDKQPTKKQKGSHEDNAVGDGIKAESGQEVKKDKNVARKSKKKKKKKAANEEEKETQNDTTSDCFNVIPVKIINDDNGGDPVDEAEFYAWNELRLHPLLMKSIRRLGFKEPTPIQKVCIPAAAHQGKDVVGAAETGSGKTLAFGLPIFQRLLEELEKSTNILEEDGESSKKFAPRGVLRALIITPTRELAIQVTDHLKEVAKGTNIRVVPIVGGMSMEKQARLLKTRPEIIIGTPGRLWELMSRGETHLVELHSLSFFVLDEADRMIQTGHFRELQSITEMLPTASGSIEAQSPDTQNCVTISNFQRKKRQTFVFSATIALSADFRKKLKRGSLKLKTLAYDGGNSIEALFERAGLRANAAIVDLTNASILAKNLEEAFIECREEDKDAYLYYILSVHGQGQTIVFCTSIAALRHISSILRTLKIKVSTLHAQKQQRARLKEIDNFRGNKNGVLVATDVAARGLDIPGVRTVVHYQLPHSAEVYVHRSGRTARAQDDGCSISLISPNDRSKFASLCKSFSKEFFWQFPIELSYMQEIDKRLSLARQIDKITRRDSQEKAKQTWFERNAEAVGLVVEENDSEEERVNKHKQKKFSSMRLDKLQQELGILLSHPLQPQTLKHKFLAGAGVSPLLQDQLEQLAEEKQGDNDCAGESRGKNLMVIGKDCVEAIHALRSSGHEVHMGVKETAEKRKTMESLRRKRKEEKTRLRDQQRKHKKRLKGNE